jgi:hypothetical protein
MGLLEMTALGGIIRGDDGGGVASGQFVDHEMVSARGPSEHGPSVRMRVVGPTCQNPWRVVRAVSALLRDPDPALELVVEETCRRGSSVAQVRAETCPGERRLENRAKARPGVASTRARGAVDARDGLVVFVDDDAVVDPYWTTALRAPQNSGSRQSYGVLMGTLPPLRVECDAALFSFGEGRFEDLEPGDACGVGRARSGAGAVVAIARDFASARCVPAPVLPRLCAFDARLGAGTPTRVGRDIDFVVRARAPGYALRHALSAAVWREYPESLRGVFRRIHAANGGVSATLTKHLPGGAHRLWHLQRTSADVRPLTRSRTLRAPVRADAYPRTVPWAEALGDPAGPVGYPRSAWLGRDGQL